MTSSGAGDNGCEAEKHGSDTLGSSNPTVLHFYSKAITEENSSGKYACYGTVIYLPENYIIDFGPPQYPTRYNKKLVCPRVLLLSSWADGKFGFVGGGREKIDARPIDCMNREFDEEMGTAGGDVFNEHDYLFTVKTEMHSTRGKITKFTHIFCKLTQELRFFNGLLSSFHTDRDAYLDEVFGIVTLPLWIEAPEDICGVPYHHVLGIPRLICGNCGAGCLTTQTSLHPVDDFRNQFLLTLLMTKVVSIPLMKRIFYLSTAFSTAIPMKTFKEFTSQNGIRRSLLLSYNEDIVFVGETRCWRHSEITLRELISSLYESDPLEAFESSIVENWEAWGLLTHS